MCVRDRNANQIDFLESAGVENGGKLWPYHIFIFP